MSSHLLPGIKLGPSRISDFGLFTTSKIEKGEVVVDYSAGIGQYINSEKADELYRKGLDQMVQVDDDLFFAVADESQIEDADRVNHSCDPNCGLKDKLKFIAMRDIEPGEEITIDYAMFESSDYGFKCNCGSDKCRGVVTGDDWKIPKLQDKYKGYFSDYIEKKIAR